MLKIIIMDVSYQRTKHNQEYIDLIQLEMYNSEEKNGCLKSLEN